MINSFEEEFAFFLERGYFYGIDAALCVILPASE